MKSRPKVRPGKEDSWGRNERRRAGDRIAGASSEHGEIHFHEAGAAIRFGQSTADASEPDGADVPIERRRYPRGAEDHDLVAGVLVAGGVPREDQDAV